jgi:hypothetical protein
MAARRRGEPERVVIEVGCVMMAWRCGVVVQMSANFRVPVSIYAGPKLIRCSSSGTPAYLR